MIKYLTGDILFSKCQTLVNPVNCVGVMGKGLALRFRKAYPDMYLRYKSICQRGLLKPGMLWLYQSLSGTKVLCFPTKEDWREPSKIVWIEDGLRKFVTTYREKGIASAAFPLLGVGLGGLDKSTVMSILEEYLSDCDIPIEIYSTYVPYSKTFIPLIERLVGELTDDQKKEIIIKLCHE